MTMMDDHGAKVTTMKTVPAGEFKAKCLQLMDEVDETGEPVLITKRGRPVARLVPVETARSLLGCLAGRMEIAGDLTESPWDDAGGAEAVVEKWDRLHRAP